MREALYRKYRPKLLSEVVGQPHITATLTNSINNGRISHGYLFAGPRGVGKTSVARIMAHQVNGFEYGDSSGALDIIEIDAASNRRIEEIRNLRDKIHAAPTIGKYKVYIIDEVHMLTREAFNALLKTLEEPPAHVIFILATTEAHKLPETIVSRTQRYTFKAIATNDIVSHLQDLAKLENIKIDNEALRAIAEHGDGSFRDSISLLDQLSPLSNITKDDVSTLLGLPSDELLNTIYDATINLDISLLSESLNSAYGTGLDASRLASKLVDKIRQQNKHMPEIRQIKLAKQLLEVQSSPDPSRLLELILIDYALSQDSTSQAPIIKTEPINTPQPKTNPLPSAPAKEKPTKAERIAESTVDTTTTQVSPKQQISDVADIVEIWEKLLTHLKKHHNTLYGLGRMAKASSDEQKLVLHVPFAFHKKQLLQEKNSAIIRNALLEICGQPLEYAVEINSASNKTDTNDNSPKTATNKDTFDAPKALNNITAVFGSAEVLEI